MVIFSTENQNQLHSGKSLSLLLNQKYKLFLIKKIPNISKILERRTCTIKHENIDINIIHTYKNMSRIKV